MCLLFSAMLLRHWWVREREWVDVWSANCWRSFQCGLARVHQSSLNVFNCCVELPRNTTNQPTNTKWKKKISEEEAAHTHYIPTCGHFNIIILDACAACFSRLLVCNFSIWFPIHSANKTNRMWHVCVCVTLNTLRSSDSDAVKILWRKKKWIAEQSVPRITIFIYRCLF